MSEFTKVASVDEIREAGADVVAENGQAIALFWEDGEVHAVDNRCPHMGFPLTEGSVDEGVLTCHWHHARFELSCGDTFDPWADDVPTYPVEIRNGDVYVKPEQIRDKPPAEHWLDRLDTGMEESLNLVLAKAAVGLDHAGVDYAVPFAEVLDFGTSYRAGGWASGLTIHTALANLIDDLEGKDRRRALYHGSMHVASDCAGEPPKFDQPAFKNKDVPPERLKSWFRENVEVRDEDGTERVLRTAIQDLDQEEVAELIFAAVTDHVYVDTGHALDYCNKAFEALDHAGWEHAEDVLPSLVPVLANVSRSEERAQWRQPIDLADMLFDAYEDFPAIVDDPENAGGETDWTEPDGFMDTLLSDDPQAIVDALVEAVESGASTTDLAMVVRDAAAKRIAQFATSNEFNDWNTVLHTFTYVNAVTQATRRTGAWELYRGVFDAALNVYLDRFLNMPPARWPEGDDSVDPDDAIEGFHDACRTEGEVNRAGQAVADFLAAGGSEDRLRAELGAAILREDTGFHTYQVVEAAITGAREAVDDRVPWYYVAAARYVAAHTPTRREREQTYSIAERLGRGERLHEA